jgi:hypothetical protein
LNVVPKNAISVVPSKCALIYVRAKARTGTKPFVLLKTFTTPKIILILKVTSILVGCDFGVTIESTSIFPPSLYPSLLYVLDSDVDPKWAYTLSKLKSGITK